MRPPTDRSLVWYFVLAYAISWMLWFPRIATLRGWWSVDVPAWWHYTGAARPVTAALVMAALTDGWAGLRHLLGQYAPSRPPACWLAFAAVSPIALLALALPIARLVDGRWPSYDDLARTGDFPDVGLPLMLVVHILTFGIGEETGWRGFALPRLQRTRTALAATHVLAIFWAGWHIPSFWENDGMMEMSLFQMVGWCAGLWMGAIFLTWLYNSSREACWRSSSGMGYSTCFRPPMPAMSFRPS